MRPLRVLLLLGVLPALLAAAPARAEHVDSKGLIYLGRGAYPAAMGWYRAIWDLDPDAAGAAGGLALAKCRVGRVDEARAHLAEVDGSTEPLVLTARACVAAFDGEVAAALELHRAAADASRFPFHLRQLVRYLADLGRFEEAERWLDEMRRAGWEGRQTEALRAECRLGVDDVEGALDHLELTRMGPSGPHRTPLVETLAALATGRLDDPAAAAFLLQVTPFSAAHDAVSLRAEALRRGGDLDGAETEAGRRKRDPVHPVAWVALARVAADLGDAETASAYLDEARRRWPDHPSVVLTAALIEARAGEPGARARLERAIALGVPAWDADVVDDVRAALAEPR